MTWATALSRASRMRSFFLPPERGKTAHQKGEITLTLRAPGVPAWTRRACLPVPSIHRVLVRRSSGPWLSSKRGGLVRLSSQPSEGFCSVPERSRS
jgi:hypothetical protein